MPRKIKSDDIMITRDLMSRQLVLQVTLPNGEMVQDDVHLGAITDMVPDILARSGQDITDLLAAEIANSFYLLPDDVLDWADEVGKRLLTVEWLGGWRYRATLANGSHYITEVREARFAPFLEDAPALQAAE